MSCHTMRHEFCTLQWCIENTLGSKIHFSSAVGLAAIKKNVSYSCPTSLDMTCIYMNHSMF